MKRFWFLLFVLSLIACGGETTPSNNSAPTAAFITSTQSGVAPLAVNFDASSSSDSDGSISSYAWTFGDGNSATGVTSSHTYVSAGSFTVSLTVTDNGGATNTTTKTVAVTQGSSSSSISGSLTLSSTSFGASSGLGETESLEFEITEPDISFDAPSSNVIAGEVLVKFRDGLSTQATSLQVASTRFNQLSISALPNTKVFKAEGISQEDTVRLAAELAARADVLYASPNRMYQPLRIPNDEFYSFQWHYASINLPQAWDQTIGDPGTVVAVIDTGIINHPEMTGKLVAGFDFVSNAANAADGDGIDSDPTDTGPEQDTGYHGTHVAGTIAARTNDGSGVAGVDWNAKISAVRVLGVQGGSTSDIIDGVLWAAGLHPTITNPNPADVLNLSLGGESPCEAIEQEAYDRAIAAGKIIVVAAGNDNVDARFFSPANCDNVITVGASEFADARAPYSNFGPRIDVMAPGGDTSADLNNDTYIDGVLSLGFNDNERTFAFPFYQGTSMAAPHVAGVASLMKAVKPTITQAEVLAALSTTARPLTNSACSSGNSSVGNNACGAGLIDANAALQAIDSTSPPPPPPSGQGLTFTPLSLIFGTDLTEIQATLQNNDASTLNWSATQFFNDDDNPGVVADLGVLISDFNGSIAANSSQTVTIGVDRSKASVDGTYSLEVEFVVNGTTPVRYPISFTKGVETSAPTGDLSGTEVLLCGVPFVNDLCNPNSTKFIDVVGNGTRVNYDSGELGQGEYILIAAKDNNANDDLDSGDYFGFYSVDSLGATEVTPPASNINFPMEELSDADVALSNEARRLFLAFKQAE